EFLYAAGCEGVMGKTAPSHTHINPSASFTSSLSGSSNQSLKSSMSEDEIVDVREVPSAGSADEQSSDFSLNSSDSCEKPVFQENLEKPEDLQTDKDMAKMSRKGNRKTEAFELMEVRNLVGNQGIYKVQEFLGQGSFGKVAKCTKLGSPEMYAIKIITNVQEGKEEFESMKLIQVNFHDSLMNEQQLVPLCYIRVIAQQLLKALKALKSIGVAHCDIKLDNIMFKDLDDMNVKLIDFGLAVETNEILTGTKMQVTQFRAPEVILGLPLDESVDMWALGMVLACVYCGYYLFLSSTEYETIRAMVHIFGLPEADVLHRANYKDAFFTRDNIIDSIIDFDAMTDKHRNIQALEHDFITMKHLAGKSKAAYAAGCEGVMGKTPPSEAQVNPSAPSKEELLSTGLYTQDYFTWDSGVNGWRLLTAEEYTQRTMSNVNGNHVINLDQMTEIHRKQFDMYDDDDHKAFIDLLKRMLEVNPQCRITPSQALEHDFITMKHLAGKKCCQDEEVIGDRQLGRKKKNLSSDKHGS
uniref:Protein kinase domain-containing protein n=1 Tax=Oryzias latipes TaxID=8090 RepID=A0A3B3H6Z6_ORYLA